jgi:hypothetical protein
MKIKSEQENIDNNDRRAGEHLMRMTEEQENIR